VLLAGWKKIQAGWLPCVSVRILIWVAAGTAPTNELVAAVPYPPIASNAPVVLNVIKLVADVVLVD
jgi:hypothetical protein